MRALEAELSKFPDAGALAVTVVDAPDVVGMHEAPTTALRRKPGASIRVAVQQVADGHASAVVSAGSTGATVMAARTGLGLVAGVDRPALAALIPTTGRPAVLLDVGANAECRPGHLVQFGVMGAVFAQIALGLDRPRVGLLSIGEEESKGNELTREAHQLLKARRSTSSATSKRVMCMPAWPTSSCVTASPATSRSRSARAWWRRSRLLATTARTPELRAPAARGAFRRLDAWTTRVRRGPAARRQGHRHRRARALDGHGRANAVGLAHRFAESRLVERLERGIAAMPVSAT